jgi:hypothetical protein
MRRVIRALLGALAVAVLAAAAPSPDVRIAIRPLSARLWEARYVLSQPANRLVFARNPDDSRARLWRATDPAFEIVDVDHEEVIRRRDGRPFAAVAVSLTPDYVDLPKDYAPFSPFSDGGLLFHSGRFFACPDRCGSDPEWSMRFTGSAGTEILVHGQATKREARWIDRDDGTNVYIGLTRPIETPHVLAIVDAGLPEPVRAPLSSIFPRFMDYFSEHVAPLDAKPMLFASYEPVYPHGHGSQGGTLPGQVFIHYYGAGWPERMAKPDFAWQVAFFFAHEAGHLHQGKLIETSWINEGGADAFAYRALAALIPDARHYLDARLAGARKGCAEALTRTTLADAMKAGEIDMLYQCGLVINERVDRSLRAGGGSDGVFSVWKYYRANGRGDEDSYLAAIAQSGGPGLADWARHIAHDRFATAEEATAAFDQPLSCGSIAASC